MKKKFLKNQSLDYHQKIHLQAYAIFILRIEVIMFKYIENSINVYQTKANKFHLVNLLKHTKSQLTMISYTVYGFHFVSDFMGCQI